MVNENRIFFSQIFTFRQFVTSDINCTFSHQRHSCNPVVLFDAVVEKYCPDNMMKIKVCFFIIIPESIYKKIGINANINLLHIFMTPRLFL